MPIKAEQTTAECAQEEALSPKNAHEHVSWYSGITSFFAGSGGDEGRHDVLLATTSNHNDSEERENIDDDSTAASTVSTLGKSIDGDLQSLPSEKDSIVSDGDSIDVFEAGENASVKTKSKKYSRSFSKSDVEAVVEKKINNLKIEGNTMRQDDDTSVLRKKMFPNFSRRHELDSVSESDENIEARRHLLVKELRSAVNSFGRYDPRCANITAALGDLYSEKREYKQSIRLHQDAIVVYSTILGDDHETTLEAKTRLGQIQQHAGDHDEAIANLFFVLCMVKALKGDKSVSASDAMMNVAAALRHKGKHSFAIKTVKKALKHYRQNLGDSHPKVSSAVDEIASLYTSTGDFSKASAILEELVKLKVATLGMANVEVARSLTQLATCYEHAEEYGKAMKNLKKAYKIHADLDGESGEDAIQTLERIALIYQTTREFKKASIAYLGVLRGRKHVLGESHPAVADTYFHLGVSLRESDQHEKAFKCMKQALNIYVGEGRDMYDVEMIAEVMHELAAIHKANDNISESIKTFKQELAIRRKLGQADYPMISQTLNHLGVTEFVHKSHKEALSHFMEALTICENGGHQSGTDFAEILYNTGLVFEAVGKTNRAHDAFVESACIFKANKYDETHPHLLKAINKLKHIGHSCRCRKRQCSSTPCQSILDEKFKNSTSSC